MGPSPAGEGGATSVWGGKLIGGIENPRGVKKGAMHCNLVLDFLFMLTAVDRASARINSEGAHTSHAVSERRTPTLTSPCRQDLKSFSCEPAYIEEKSWLGSSGCISFLSRRKRSRRKRQRRRSNNSSNQVILHALALLAESLLLPVSPPNSRAGLARSFFHSNLSSKTLLEHLL